VVHNDDDDDDGGFSFAFGLLLADTTVKTLGSFETSDSAAFNGYWFGYAMG
jgi:hypothetical protein